MTGPQINRFCLVTNGRAPYIAWVLSQKNRTTTSTVLVRVMTQRWLGIGSSPRCEEL
jgi:hypothetical protein